MRRCSSAWMASSRGSVYKTNRAVAPVGFAQPAINSGVIDLSAGSSEMAGGATTTRPSPMSARPFANIWRAASLPTASPGRGATIVDTTTSWPIPAKAGVVGEGTTDCANTFCAASSLGASWRRLTPKRCWPASTTASRSMRGSASTHLTVQRSNGCCASAPDHPLQSSAFAKRDPHRRNRPPGKPALARGVPEVRWADASDRLCHRGHADQEDP